MARAPHDAHATNSPPDHARHVARLIVAHLRDHGHDAYFAGGCVRDELLGLHPTDYDIATDAPPARIRALFSRTNEVGAAFGVMLVAIDGVTVEVATFRSDGTYTDARRPDSVRFSDAPSDAARRDFTINALFLDPLAPPDPTLKHPHAPRSSGALDPKHQVHGRVIDYVGGVDDLHARILRAVGDPEQRLREDHLRALRAVRFAARLEFDIHADTASAIRRHAQSLRGVSRERIGDELRRMLTHPRRALAVRWLDDLGLSTPVLNASPEDELRAAAAASAEASRSTGAGANTRSSMILAGLSTSRAVTFPQALAAWMLDRAGGLPGALARGPKDSAEFTRTTTRHCRAALCLSNDESEQLSDALALFDVLVTRWGELRVSAQKRAAARAAFAPTLELLAGADAARSEPIRLRYKELESDGVGINPSPLVTGDHLVAHGYKPGPAFKRVLDEVYDAQLEGAVQTHDQALELARRLYV